ncbi:hypothetical protein LNO78_28540 [Klebsiella pneumoniae subsp. pneumoniae]|nr:hypothetical protein [Klebsiella pneumoniae subsp. pneumoniae]
MNLINKYLFKEDIQRCEDDAPPSVKEFWKRATRQNMNIDDFMVEVDLQSSIYGRIWVVVDSTVSGDIESKEDQKKSDGRAYAYWVSPQQMLDCAWDEEGNLSWILICEVSRDDADPFTSSGKEFLRYRLWTKDHWYLFAKIARGSGQVVERKLFWKILESTVSAWFLSSLLTVWVRANRRTSVHH